jgi:hypothetical protein
MPWVNKHPIVAACKAARTWQPYARNENSPGLSGRVAVGLETQGVGLRPQPWAGVSRPVGPDVVRESVLVNVGLFVQRKGWPAKPGMIVIPRRAIAANRDGPREARDNHRPSLGNRREPREGSPEARDDRRPAGETAPKGGMTVAPGGVAFAPAGWPLPHLELRPRREGWRLRNLERPSSLPAAGGVGLDLPSGVASPGAKQPEEVFQGPWDGCIPDTGMKPPPEE